MSEQRQHDRVIPPPPQPGDVYEVPAAGSLGLLALGAVGLKAWREKRDEAGVWPDVVQSVPEDASQAKAAQQEAVQAAVAEKQRSLSQRIRRFLKRHTRRRLAKKVLLIGWDAADWRVINPLMDAGLMPALESLVNVGVIGNLATLDPPLSPMLWTSISTGMFADKHGVLGFTQPDPERQLIRPVLGSTRKVKAMWNILNQEGFRCHVIGWWPSHPAEPIDGVYVSNFYHRAHGPFGHPWPMMTGTVHPEELAGTLAGLRIHPQELTAAHILPFVPQAVEIQHEIDQIEDEKEREQKQKRLTSVAKIIAECATVHAAATWVMENEEWDFFAVYYDAIDHFGHGFMRFHPPRREGIPEELFERYNYVVTAGYRFHDMMLGRLLHLAGPDTTVILVSDHGFHPDHLRPKGIPKEPAGPAVEHRDLGVICLRGPHIQKDERVYGASLLDVAPTVLTLFGLPVGRDMDGRPLAEVFDKPIEPDYIPTWETVAGESGMYPPETQQDPWAEQAALERLIELGYVEPPGEDKKEAVEKSVRESRFYLARVYLSTRRRQEALPILEELYRQAPKERRYALRLAQCYRNLNRLEDCRRVIEELLVREEESFPALDLLQGTLLLAEEKPQEALVYLEKAEQTEPRRPDLHRRIGSAYLQMREWVLAEGAFHKALEIDPDSASAYRGLAVATLRQQRYDEAAEAALASVGRIYYNPSGHYYLGEALLRLGEYERAAEAYRVAVSQSPGMRLAHLRLVRLYRDYLDKPVLAEEHRRFAEERIRAD